MAALVETHSSIADSLALLTTERLDLVIPGAGSGELALDYYERNRGHLEPWEPHRARGFYTLEYWRKRFQHYQREFENGVSARAVLMLRHAPACIIGTCALTHLGDRGSCQLGYSLDFRFQGRGLMSETVSKMCEFAFYNLRLERVNASYMPKNERSAQLLHKQGFLIEGFARACVEINGRYEDHVLTARLNPALRESRK